MTEQVDQSLKHVAIVMDGNGRWAQSRGQKRTDGHKAGVKALMNLLNAADEFSFKYLTIYAFSTENWQRSDDEVSTLMNLMRFYLKRELSNLHKKNVCLRIIGDKTRLEADLQKDLIAAEEKTKNNDGFVLNVALNYGSKDEITRATQHIAQDVKTGILTPDQITQDLFSSYLDTKESPDVDLFIRPSGEIRISNFLLWQSAYAEFYFTDVLWPDFDKNELRKAIDCYAKRQRRFGGSDETHAA